MVSSITEAIANQPVVVESRGSEFCFLGKSQAYAASTSSAPVHPKRRGPKRFLWVADHHHKSRKRASFKHLFEFSGFLFSATAYQSVTPCSMELTRGATRSLNDAPAVKQKPAGFPECLLQLNRCLSQLDHSVTVAQYLTTDSGLLVRQLGCTTRCPYPAPVSQHLKRLAVPVCSWPRHLLVGVNSCKGRLPRRTVP